MGKVDKKRFDGSKAKRLENEKGMQFVHSSMLTVWISNL